MNTPIQINAYKHAELSCSGADGWMNCVQWSGNSGANSYAAEGTCAHELASICLAMDYDATHYLGQVFTADGFEFVANEDMCENVQMYLDYVRSIPGTLLVEQRMPIEHITGELGATGTSDSVILGDNVITIVDLKYGMGVRVEASGPQLAMYGASAAQEYDYLGPFATVRVVIHQPRLNHVSEFEYTRAELDAFVAKAAQAAAAYMVKGEDANPGEKQCRWCSKKAECPELAAQVMDTMADTPINLGMEILPQLGSIMELIDHSDNARLARCLSSADLIEGWLKAIRAKVESLLFLGVDVPGYKLVQGKRSNRAWTDDAAAMRVLKNAKVPMADRFTKKLISPTAASKLLKDSPYLARLERVIMQSEGSPSVAKSTDKRPAIDLGAGVGMTALPETTPDFPH